MEERAVRVRTAVIASIVWILLAFGLGMVGVARIHNTRVPGMSRKRRSEKLGRGLGQVAAIGCLGIWGVWFVKRKKD